MSIADKVTISRRPFVSGLLGIIALAGIGALEAPRLFPKFFARRYPPTSFDDLLALLPDRENAVRVGNALKATGCIPVSPRGLAADLRRRLGSHSLAIAISGDLTHNRLIEAQGWLLPASLAELCWLAAMAEPS